MYDELSGDGGRRAWRGGQSDWTIRLCGERDLEYGLAVLGRVERVADPNYVHGIELRHRHWPGWAGGQPQRQIPLRGQPGVEHRLRVLGRRRWVAVSTLY